MFSHFQINSTNLRHKIGQVIFFRFTHRSTNRGQKIESVAGSVSHFASHRTNDGNCPALDRVKKLGVPTTWAKVKIEATLLQLGKEG